jgi:glutathione S-transferase
VAPILFHDPTSEPSRAVHWFTLEAGITVAVRHIWLSRGQHLSPEFLLINPRHQVPAFREADFCLSEATAIIRYLAETHRAGAHWLGGTARERARVNQLLSWYHTNLRKKATLEYFLPVLLAPAYRGQPRPSDEVVRQLRHHLRAALEQVDEFLGSGPFLGATYLTVPDLLFASEIFALDCDHERDVYLTGLTRVVNWLDRLRGLGSYASSHGPWNAVVPMMQKKLRDGVASGSDPSWVADAAEAAIEHFSDPHLS